MYSTVTHTLGLPRRAACALGIVYPGAGPPPAHGRGYGFRARVRVSVPAEYRCVAEGLAAAHQVLAHKLLQHRRRDAPAIAPG
eukprot:scaffold41452_cov65-Phaeocystis_antarctica.AAC.2